MGLCIANIFVEYNHQDAAFLNLFISVICSTCFRQFFRPSSGAQNCIYSVRYLSEQYCCLLSAGSSNKYLTLYVQFRAPDDGRKNRLKHVEHLTEINKLRNVTSCWLYSTNTSTCSHLCVLLYSENKVNESCQSGYTFNFQDV